MVPKILGANATVVFNDDEYTKGLRVEEHFHSLIRRLVLSKGDSPLATMKLKSKISARCLVNTSV